MRRTQRLIAASILVAFAGMLGGCSSGGFDPTDLLDFLDTKKKLPGDRKPVFPDGVPGLEQGVPKDLYKSEVEKQQQEQAAAAQAANAPPPAEDPKAKRAAKSKKGKATAAASTAPAGAEAAPEEEATPAAPPPPKPAKVARKRTTAPPPDADGSAPAATQSTQQSQGAFPAPMPSGSFTR